MCWRTSVVSLLSRSSASLTLSWRRRTRVPGTSSTTWGCLMSASIVSPRRTSNLRSLPTPLTLRPLTPWCRARQRLSSITAGTRRARRLVFNHITTYCVITLFNTPSCSCCPSLDGFVLVHVAHHLMDLFMSPIIRWVCPCSCRPSLNGFVLVHVAHHSMGFSLFRYLACE